LSHDEVGNIAGFTYSLLIVVDFLWYAKQMMRIRLNRKWSTALTMPLYVLVFTFYPYVHSQAASWTLSAEEWARPRSAQSLVQMKPLIATMQAFNSQSSSQLVIRYPGGEEGALWASELRDWLVSLGVPSARIEVRPGQSTYESISLILKNPKESRK